MKEFDLDTLLNSVPQAAPSRVSPAVMEGVRASILQDLKRVRPMPPTGLLAPVFLTITLAIAIGGAAALGFGGFRALEPLQRTVIYAVLALTATLGSIAVSQAMIPAARSLPPLVIALAPSSLMLVVFAALFNDYGAGRFIAEGIRCLLTGAGVAAITACTLALLVRRGVVLNPVAAGTTMGTLAGLAGVALLELHCPNKAVPHNAVWHVSVILLSTLVGRLAGTLADARAG